MHLSTWKVTFLSVLSCLLVSFSACQKPPAASTLPSLFQDDFSTGVLDTSRWNITQQNDFQDVAVEVSNISKDISLQDYRLRMMANTLNTNDTTVKFTGVRSVRKIEFTDGAVISLDIDWNNQKNGCYLTTGVFLCPLETDTNPMDTPDWIAFEYIGVPPGELARFQVARTLQKNLNMLYTEGWPIERSGRKIGNQHLELAIGNKSLRVIENGQELFSTNNHELLFTQAYLYLQMSSHSNYPSREVYFDNISVSKWPITPK